MFKKKLRPEAMIEAQPAPKVSSAREILLERLAFLSDRGATWISPKGRKCLLGPDHLEILDDPGKRIGRWGTFMPYRSIVADGDLEKITKEASFQPLAEATPEWVADRIRDKALRGENTHWDESLAHHFWGGERIGGILARSMAEAQTDAPLKKNDTERHSEPSDQQNAVASPPEASASKPLNAKPGEDPWWIDENPEPPPF